MHQKLATTNLPTQFGVFKLSVFSNKPTNKEILVMRKGNDIENVLCRIHSSCIKGETFGSLRCDCGEQLNESLKLINLHGGILIYLFQEGRGIGLVNKIKAYFLQENGHDTISANQELGFPNDLREYSSVKEILGHFNIRSIQLITNNPDKLSQIKSLGIGVKKTINLPVSKSKYNSKYLQTKIKNLYHSIAFKT